MARSVRKGVLLRLGVLSTPVDLITAVDTGSAPKFHTACASGHEPERVKQSLKCPECDNDDRSSFVKAAPTDDGLVVVDGDTLADAVPEDVKDTVGLTAHPTEDLAGQSVEGGKVYFLAPGKGGEDVYVLLREAVSKRRDVSLLAEFAVRGKPSLFRLDTFRDALVLTEIAWPEAIREAPAPTAVVPDGALEMLGQIIDRSMQPFDPDEYRDTRSAHLQAAIDAASSGDATVLKAVAPAKPANDLMSQLSAALGDAA